MFLPDHSTLLRYIPQQVAEPDCPGFSFLKLSDINSFATKYLHTSD